LGYILREPLSSSLENRAEVLIMDVFEAIKGRRSIRKYESDPVPDAVLNEVLEAVRWAPSWANTQCWEVIVIREPEIKAKVAEALPPTNPALSALRDAPVLLVFCAIRNCSGFKRGEVTTDKGDWFMFDIGLAMENLCLAAHSLGLGTVIIGLFDAKKAESLLGVPENVSVVAMSPLGYPQGEISGPKRKELADFVFFRGIPEIPGYMISLKVPNWMNLSQPQLRGLSSLGPPRKFCWQAV
jgi:nitroreductase